MSAGERPRVTRCEYCEKLIGVPERGPVRRLCDVSCWRALEKRKKLWARMTPDDVEAWRDLGGRVRVEEK